MAPILSVLPPFVFIAEPSMAGLGERAKKSVTRPKPRALVALASSRFLFTT